MALLASCAPQQQDAWMNTAKYVEETDVPFSCGKARAGIEVFLANREDTKMFGGDFIYEERNTEEECGRFVLKKTFSDSIDAIIVLVPLSWDETKIVIYQRYFGKMSRDLAYAIEDLANKKQ